MSEAKAMPEKMAVGRRVLYVLSEWDAENVNRRRAAGPQGEGWPAGAQAHFGNRATAGDVLPLDVVRVWSPTCVNGQAILDGNDTLWVTSVSAGTAPGSWYWPERG